MIQRLSSLRAWGSDGETQAIYRPVPCLPGGIPTILYVRGGLINGYLYANVNNKKT
jgi:hypothetical protein